MSAGIHRKLAGHTPVKERLLETNIQDLVKATVDIDVPAR